MDEIELEPWSSNGLTEQAKHGGFCHHQVFVIRQAFWWQE
jgi:hypothetical protein